MKRFLFVLVVAGTMVVAACSDQNGPTRPLGLSAAGDTSGGPPPDSTPPDSTPPPDTTPAHKPGPVASVTVSPESATVVVGDSAGFFADLRDARGNPARNANVKWSVADPRVARIEGAFGQSVILRALGRGATTVTAKSHGKTGSALLVVSDSQPPPPPPPGDSVATVTVTPDTIQVAAGDTANFFATLRDANGNILSGRPVAWSVSDSTVAQIEGAFGSSVVIRALRSGTSLITATSAGKSGAGTLFVR